MRKVVVSLFALTLSAVAQQSEPFPPGATAEEKKAIIRERFERQRIEANEAAAREKEADRRAYKRKVLSNFLDGSIKDGERDLPSYDEEHPQEIGPIVNLLNRLIEMHNGEVKNRGFAQSDQKLKVFGHYIRRLISQVQTYSRFASEDLPKLPDPERIRSSVRAKTIFVGMPQAAVIGALGTPDDISGSTSASGRSEQWSYKDSNVDSVYIENGVVTSFQD